MTDSDSPPRPAESKKPVKEVLVVHDQGEFTHPTGDSYIGFFEAKKKDRSVKMHGPGVYRTAEGDVYTGTWETDKLTEAATIEYNDGSKYEGPIKDWCYSGPASYFFPDGCVFQGSFSENCPVGNLTVCDPNGHFWYAKAQNGFAWFEATNHYYEMLDKVPPTKPRRKADKSRMLSPSTIDTPSDTSSKKQVKF